ncbi:hypothetical protein KPH14_010342 [Odynerus spinipes]|uniref:Uncharacterized protein n=1 Tax=Odynerus spinipes TaxID=1348599 RepID=A0AAD9RTU2_9HYME|nr:hypothetical protein KPH14_010342 [Odynerus spinipes]
MMDDKSDGTVVKWDLPEKDKNDVPFRDFDNDDEDRLYEEAYGEDETSWIEKEQREEMKIKDIESEEKKLETWDESIFGSIGEEEEYVESSELEKRDDSIALLELSSREKSEEEVRESVEPDYVLAEIPAEVLADREAAIDMLKGLLLEMKPLRRKNKLLEVRVHQHMKKIQRKTTFGDVGKTTEETEATYGKALAIYKYRIDQAISQETQVFVEIGSYKNKLLDMREEDERIFGELIEQEREVAVGLVYVKTGGKITEKVADAMAKRQSFEVLGEGMTTMDYETLRMANVNYVDKLDERERDLEKLRTM